MKVRMIHSVPLLALSVLGFTACVDAEPGPAEPPLETQAYVADLIPPPPAGLVSVTFAERTVRFWPFTGTDLAGSAADPMNLVFAGRVDVLSLRAALMALDGDRTAYGLPAGPPFDCRWTDAWGDVQSAYSTLGGWVANPVQLACGNYYNPIRFHIRLFPAGDWVLGGTHFDLLIPGSADHRVISWELPEQLLMLDLHRAGILNPQRPFGTAAINPLPSYKEVEKEIVSGMPAALKALVGFPLGPVTANVPVPSNGQAVIFNVATRTPLDPSTTTESFELVYDIAIPRPFCASGPADIVYVQGPVRFENRVSSDGLGGYQSWQIARGELTGTPIDPTTGQPIGPTFRARAEELHTVAYNGGRFHISALVSRLAFPPTGRDVQTLLQVLSVGNHYATFSRKERC
jgi:hypothetical protein